jgi:hypothetical protein
LALLLIIVVVWVVVARGSDEAGETDPDAILTQAMQTALARMTETPEVAATLTSTWTALPSLTASPTGAVNPTVTTAPTQTSPVVPSCDVAGFVADITIPDGTEMAPGTNFQKIWELRNDGTCTWNANYDVIFYSGAQMNGASPQQLTTGEVLPGQTIQIAIDMIAPADQGRHIGNWVLRNDSGATFGIGGASPFYVDITVTGEVVPTATETSPIIPTDTSEPSPTDTQPPAPTDTEEPKPSDTPEPTAYP